VTTWGRCVTSMLVLQDSVCLGEGSSTPESSPFLKEFRFQACMCWAAAHKARCDSSLHLHMTAHAQTCRMTISGTSPATGSSQQTALRACQLWAAYCSRRNPTNPTNLTQPPKPTHVVASMTLSCAWPCSFIAQLKHNTASMPLSCARHQYCCSSWHSYNTAHNHQQERNTA
jgi:hypothetical protein